MGQLYRKGCVALLLCWAACAVPAAASGSRTAIPSPFAADRPPGRMVDIGGYALHIYCLGPWDGPSVVFDAGLGGFSMDWLFVQHALAGEARVCAYDRAGYGWSDPGPSPRVTEQIAAELETLLERAGVAPPYVLVGHSFGGYNMEYFAATHPDATAGLVLVDASHPEQARRLPALPAQSPHAHQGTLITFFDPRSIYAHFPEEMWYVMGALMSSAKAMTTQQREFLNFEMSAGQVLGVGRLPPVPLVVVTRGRRVWPQTPLGDALERTWRELQAELASGTPGGRQMLAGNSGHLVHLDEPGVVAAAVRDVLREASCRRRGGACAATAP
jgi:pimeloyl-ACP methyl ester carboxylesterase